MSLGFLITGATTASAARSGPGLGQGLSAHGGHHERAPTIRGRRSGKSGGEGDLGLSQIAAAEDNLFLKGLQRWCLDVQGWGELSAEQWDLLLGLLPENERVRVQSFLRENDRKLALGSRLLQWSLVSKVFGLEFSEVDIRRTPERKPYFAAGTNASSGGFSMPPELRNWNFNVSHHGKYVAIASEPLCLCGVDLVDTNRRANEPGPAEDYLRYFTEHFTDAEWETIKRPEDDELKLRRFYLHWGLKEAFVKAIGQGLGYDLRRISFLEGDWLNCCSSSSFSSPEEDSDDDTGTESRLRRCCSCPRRPITPTATATAAVAASEWLKRGGGSGAARLRSGGGNSGAGERVGEGCGSGRSKPDTDGDGWGQEDRVGCVCGVGAAKVEVDGILQTDWSFQVFPFPNGYAACVARGPPSACSRSGQAAGVIRDPNPGSELLALGQSLPQLRFREVKLEEIVPQEAAAGLVELRRGVSGRAFAQQGAEAR
eukprot:jgi/Undpi1/6393/HiC_scaffold_20.g08874.m1